jgi:hypothetical protein
MPTPAEHRLTALSEVLWRQRRLLDLLHFKLEEERLLILAGHTGWLGRASHEVEVVLDELGASELDRAVAVADVATALGLAPQSTLALLAAAVEAPWAGLLRAHRQALRAAARQVDRASELNRALLREAMGETRRQLGALVEAVLL